MVLTNTTKNICLLIVLNLLLLYAAPHNSKVIQVPTPIQAEGLIKRLIPIDVSDSIPTLHSAKTAIAQDAKYLIVQPSQISIFHIFKHSPIQLPTNMPSLLEQLRSHRVSQYRGIVVVGEYLFLFLMPNKIVIVKEKQYPLIKTFAVENTYNLDEIKAQDDIRMYGVMNRGQVGAILTVKNSKYMYKLGLKQSQKLQLEEPMHIGHLEFVADNTFIAALHGKGIGIFSIQSNTLKKLKIYSCNELLQLQSNKNTQPISIKNQQITPSDHKTQQQEPTASCSIVDLTYDETLSKINALDKKTGVNQFDLKLISKTDDKQLTLQLRNSNKIISVSNCDALDSSTSTHFILICQTGSPNPYIQQIIKLPDPLQKNKTIFVKKDPIYHSCSFNDLIVTQNFFMAFDSFSIDVFWSGPKFISFSTEHSKQHFNIPGLEVFAFQKLPFSKDMYLFVVESNVLVKYSLQEVKGAIYAYSITPITKQITVQIPTQCDKNPTLTLNKQIQPATECIYEYKVKLDILQKIQPVNRQKISVSIGVIILMLAVLIILIWICLVKYKGMEGHARTLLEKYRQKRRYNDKKFTI